MDVEEINIGGDDGNYELEQEEEELPEDDIMQTHFATEEPPAKRHRTRGKKSDYVSYSDPGDQAISQELICMLVRFGQSDRFGTYLSSLGMKLTPSALRQLDIEQLEELKTRVIASCTNKGSSNYVAGCVYSATQAIETVVAKSSMSQHLFLTGLTECLKKDESFNDMICLYE